VGRVGVGLGVEWGGERANFLLLPRENWPFLAFGYNRYGVGVNGPIFSLDRP